MERQWVCVIIIFFWKGCYFVHQVAILDPGLSWVCVIYSYIFFFFLIFFGFSLGSCGFMEMGISWICGIWPLLAVLGIGFLGFGFFR